MYLTVKNFPLGSVMAARARNNGELFVDSLQSKRTTLAFLKRMGRDEQCSICINEFEVNESIYVLACGHMYHCQCLTPWLLTNNTCPLCRRILYENRNVVREYIMLYAPGLVRYFLPLF